MCSSDLGQEKEVNVFLILTEQEILILQNVERKEEEAKQMADGMLSHVKNIMKGQINIVEEKNSKYKTDMKKGKGWTLHLGDAVEIIEDIPDESIHYSIFSPPFASLFTYSDSERDMGNCKDKSEFLNHFKYLVKDLYRVIIPGRLLSFHCMNLPTTITADGYIGMKDFRGDLIRIFEDSGFIFHSEVCIWKDPLVQAVRTKSLVLAHKQIIKDSAMCAQGLPDYVVTMRKPGVNPEPISRKRGFENYIGERPEPRAPKSNDPKTNKYSHHVWQRYASPVWVDIRQTNTLNYAIAREDEDEKHICPLQLDVIERCLELWTNESDTILSPFSGIGSEGYVALKMKRRFIGIELKEAYYNEAVKNLRLAEKRSNKGLL